MDYLYLRIAITQAMWLSGSARILSFSKHFYLKKCNPRSGMSGLLVSVCSKGEFYITGHKSTPSSWMSFPLLSSALLKSFLWTRHKYLDFKNMKAADPCLFNT
jgi:hypothetical protein